MDQEQLAAGDEAATRGHRNEAVYAALVACRRDDEASGDVEAMDSREFNDFVTEAAAGTTTAVAGARSEDQRPRQASGHSGPHSGGVRTGATTASAAAARVRQHEDVKARDFREFDHFVKMHQQQQQTQQLLTRLQQSPSRSSAEGGGGGEVAPGPASPDLELRL